MIKKLTNTYKNNKNIFFLFFSIPLIINVFVNYSANEDIWYMLKYGEYIIHHGFPHTDMLSMHSGLHIVIQQPLSNILFYFIYHYTGSYGLFLLLEILIIIYLYLIYKLCMLLSNNKFISSILSILTVILLQSLFITPRGQLFTYLFLIITLYILEAFYKNNKTKLIYLLPIISILQINFHAAFWYILFIFMLPYIFQLIIDKNKNIYKIIIIAVVMFIVGFINPYTYENVFFPFLTYSNYINQFIAELSSPIITSSEKSLVIMSYLFYIIFGIIVLLYIYNKKGRLTIRHLLLLFGTAFMTLTSIRLISFFFIGSIPMLAYNLKNIKYDFVKDGKSTKITWIIIIIFIFIISILNSNKLKSAYSDGINYLKKKYGTDIIFYSGFDSGSYAEFVGFHPYMDTRAEVFTKKGNHKKNIFKENVQIVYYSNYYKEIFNKYKFTHLLIRKEFNIYKEIKKDKDYKIIYNKKKYAIFIKQ